MVADTAPRPAMSAAQTLTADEDAFAARWHQWQQQNGVTSRRDARRVRVAFTAIFAALAVWLVLLWVIPSLRS